MKKTLQKVAIILFLSHGVHTSPVPINLPKKPYVKNFKKLKTNLKKNNIINGDKKSLKKKNIIKKTFFPSMATNNETVYLVNDKANATFDYASLPTISTKMDAVIEGSIPDYINKKIILSKAVPSSKDLMEKYSTTENPSKSQPVKNSSNGSPSKIEFKTIENNQSQSSDFVDVLPQFQDMATDEGVKSSSKPMANENQTPAVTIAIDQNLKDISSQESHVTTQDESVVTHESNQKFQEESTTIKEESSNDTSINWEKKSKKDKSNSSSNNKEDNDESNTNPPSSYKSDENKKNKSSKIIKKIKKLIKKLPTDKKDKKNKDRKNDGKYFVTININELNGNLVASFKKLGELDPSLKIGGEVLYSKWQLNFEAPMKIDKHSKGDKSLVGFNSQLNFYYPLNSKSRKFFVSIPFGEGSKIDERINDKINEKDFGSNTDWTKGKCLFTSLNDENYSIGLGWINGTEGFFTDDSKEDDKNKKQEAHITQQFIQFKTVLFDKLILGTMLNFENITNGFSGNFFTDYELFSSGKLAANPIKISVGALLKYIFGQKVIEGYQKNQKEKEKDANPFKIEKSFLKDDLKGSFGAFNVTVEIKKIKINGENINLKLTVELKLTQKINQWSLADKEGIDLKSGTSVTVEWRIFKIKLSFKQLKIDFKNLTQKHKFLFNPYELKMKKADYLLSKEG